MSKHLSNFEQSIKNGLEGAELPYESGSWDAMSNQLDKIDNIKSSNNKLRFLIAAGIILTLGTTYFLVNNNNNNSETTAQNIATLSDAQKNSSIEKAANSKIENAKLHHENKEINSLEPNTVTDSNITNKVTDNTTTENTDLISTYKVETSNSIEKESTENTSETKSTTNKNTINTEVGSNEVSFSPSVLEACAGTEISFDVSSKNIKGSFLWNFGDGNFSNEPNPKNTYTKAGNYTITLAITSEEDGVINSNNKPVVISILPIPTAEFDWQFVSEYKEVPTIKLTNQSLNATETEWTLDEKDKSNEINVLKSFKSKGDHLINLTVTNENGCTDTKYKYISIENDYNLLAPKTFSPNDDGKYDTFLPGSLRVLAKEFEMSIYKDEKIVYQTTNFNEAWNGTYNGTKAKTGEKFPWVVILYDTNGNKQYYSGIVTVVP